MMTQKSLREEIQGPGFERFVRAAAAGENPPDSPILAMVTPKVRARHGTKNKTLPLPAPAAYHIWRAHGPQSKRPRWQRSDWSDWLEIPRMLNTLDAWPQRHDKRHGWLYLLPPFKTVFSEHPKTKETTKHRVGLALVVDRNNADPEQLIPVTFFRVGENDTQIYRRKYEAGLL